GECPSGATLSNGLDEPQSVQAPLLLPLRSSCISLRRIPRSILVVSYAPSCSLEAMSHWDKLFHSLPAFCLIPPCCAELEYSPVSRSKQIQSRFTRLAQGALITSTVWSRRGL